MPSLTGTLQSYLPATVLRAASTEPTSLDRPFADEGPVAVLFADISGFTALSERLAQGGSAGTETLSRLLNETFSRLIDGVLEHGGDILKFAGDAMLAVWPAPGGPQDLADASWRAAACSLALQEAIRTLATSSESRLSLRVGIGSGLCRVGQLGGLGGRWELVATGSPLLEIGDALHEVDPGSVVLTRGTVEAIATRCTLRPMEGGIAELLDLEEVPTAEPLRAPEWSDAFTPAALARVPMSVQARLEAGHTGWLAELRQVTVLFVNLPDLDLGVIDEAQEAALELQRILRQHEGSLNKLSVDDKGVTLLAALGLPPLSHADDAVRGVRVARALHEALASRGRRTSIGVTSGRAFCGEVGNGRRREYTLIGDVVNLAARLMQAAAGGILCDAPTRRACGERFEFSEPRGLQLKGKAGTVEAFAPLAEMAPRRAQGMVGRLKERQELARRLVLLEAGEPPGCVLVEAEAGQGKSRLIETLLQDVHARGHRLGVAKGDPVERTTPYHALRPALTALLGLEGLPADDRLRGERLGDVLDPSVAELAPLLNPILGWSLPETERTQEMEGEARSLSTRSLVLSLLTARSPLVVALEDAHWVDASSWDVLLAAREAIPGMYLVAGTRTIPEPMPSEFQRLLNGSDTLRLTLGAFTREDVLALVRDRLGASDVPDAVVDAVWSRSEGHPFFASELLVAMREAGALVVEGDRCRLAETEGTALPTTIQGLINGRVDRLGPGEQLSLKVASVVGRSFQARTVEDVYPIPRERERVPAMIAGLEPQGLLLAEADEPGAFLFNHAITQEVVYDLMLFAQRRDLHEAVARWLEERHASDLRPYYPILAHHWQRADNLSRARACFGSAGEQAMRVGAFSEAEGFLREALAIPSKLQEAPTKLERARWERLLGEAIYCQGRIVEAMQPLERAAGILGVPAPTSNLAFASSFGRALARQVMHRRFPRPPVEASQETRERWIELARIHDRLSPVYLFQNDPPRTFRACIAALNFAELARVPADIARGQANMAIATGVLGLHGIARSYLDRAAHLIKGIDLLADRCWTLIMCGLCTFAAGSWDESSTYLAESLELAERLGDTRRHGESQILLAHAAYFRGEFARAARLFAQVAAMAEARGDAHMQGGAVIGQLQTAVTLERPEEAEVLAARLDEIAPALAEVTEETYRLGIVARRQWLLDERAAAYETASRGLERMIRTPPSMAFTLEGCAAIAEVLLDAWQAGLAPEAAKRAREAIRRFGMFSRSFPIARPRLLALQSRLADLSGDRGRARRLGEEATREAAKLAMPLPRP